MLIIIIRALCIIVLGTLSPTKSPVVMGGVSPVAIVVPIVVILILVVLVVIVIAVPLFLRRQRRKGL